MAEGGGTVRTHHVPPQLSTTVVGSYPQPDWLVDRVLLRECMAPRVRVPEIWRVPPDQLGRACDEATLAVIEAQRQAGIDVITDGEIRRESYSNEFANALDGVDASRTGEIIGRTGRRIAVPVVTGPIRRIAPISVAAVTFLRAHSDRPIKATLPGPFTLAQQASDTFYHDRRSLALAYADAVRAELLELFAAGADVVQLDEPWLAARPEEARSYGVAAINRALADAPGITAVHLCFGYAALVTGKPGRYAFLGELADCVADQISVEAAQPRLDPADLKPLSSKTIVYGVLDLADPKVETAACVADRIRRALEFIPPERLMLAPDCGMKYLPEPVAFGKLRALADGAALVRARL